MTGRLYAVGKGGLAMRWELSSPKSVMLLMDNRSSSFVACPALKSLMTQVVAMRNSQIGAMFLSGNRVKDGDIFASKSKANLSGFTFPRIGGIGESNLKEEKS
jgi:hypothetical protein